MVKSILIVGGGSAGWITAAYLAKKRPELSITVVESADVPTISVGESTNPISFFWNQELGIDELEFMRACDASYKIGIKFENFRTPGQSFYHPFGYPKSNVRFRPNADRDYTSTHLCRALRFDINLSGRHSYHVDAGLYGVFLREFAKQRGVRHIVETIQAVALKPNGEIATVGGHEADLFIDCTGFRSILLGDALKVPFVSIQDALSNDRALALNLPYLDKPSELRPYTCCTALSAGWVWDIPLWSRRGTGYVYSSAHLSDEAAEEEFRAFLGPGRVRGLDMRKIRIRHGRHQATWVKNCVGIGLAAGFIEPLESTGISLTQLDVVDLERFLDDPARYNERVLTRFDATVDFIQAHYVLTARDDTPYWREQRERVTHRPGLAEIVEGARNGSYEVVERNRDVFYRPSNWNCILSGMELFGALSEHEPGAAGLATDTLPSLYEYLQERLHH